MWGFLANEAFISNASDHCTIIQKRRASTPQRLKQLILQNANTLVMTAPVSTTLYLALFSLSFSRSLSLSLSPAWHVSRNQSTSVGEKDAKCQRVHYRVALTPFTRRTGAEWQHTISVIIPSRHNVNALHQGIQMRKVSLVVACHWVGDDCLSIRGWNTNNRTGTESVCKQRCEKYSLTSRSSVQYMKDAGKHN